MSSCCIKLLIIVTFTALAFSPVAFAQSSFSPEDDLVRSPQHPTRLHRQPNPHYGINLCTKVIRENPESYNAYYHRGWLFYRLSNYTAALMDFHTLVALDPNNPASYNSRARAYIELKSYSQVIEDATKAIAINPAIADSYNLRASAYYRKGMFFHALDDYNLALAIVPNDITIVFNRGLTHLALKNYSNALNDFTYVTISDADFPGANFHRQLALRLCINAKQSETTYNQIISFNPEHPSGYVSRARERMRLGNVPEALRDLKLSMWHCFWGFPSI